MTSTYSEQKSTGAHYTPPALAAFVAKEMLKLWKLPENTRSINIFDFDAFQIMGNKSRRCSTEGKIKHATKSISRI